MSVPAILAIGLVIGGIVGTVVAVMIHFSTPTPINVGTFTLTTAPTTAPLNDKDLYATYAGSNTCRECHATEYEAWSKSHHGLAERDPDPTLDQKAFAPPHTFKHGTQETQVRLRDGNYEVITLGYDPKPTPHIIARVIGVDPLRQFLVPTTAGRFQILEASYDPNKDQWFNVYGNEDRKPGEWGHWTGRGMNWNSQCAACHNTRVRKNYDEKTDAYDTKIAQLTVNCESCHGPMKGHVDAKKNTTGLLTSVSKSPAYKFSKDQILDTCAACHARRAELTGDFAPGGLFHDHYSLTIPDLSDLFYPDGQVKEEDYEFTAFLGSKMHAAGVRCGDCHDPHSAKTLFPGNNLCMRCHNGSFQGSPTIVPEQHSFHKPDSPGNQCINCHMPVTTYMQRHARHDHGFVIPDPLLTKEHKIPNACNRCHADKDADWSLAAVDKWYGPKMQRATRERAQWIARARRQDDEARQPILRMLKEEKQPFWQAVSASILSQWLASPDVRASLIAATGSPDPLVRENAAHALQPLPEDASRKVMAKLLDDPVRAVRIRAARSFRDAIQTGSPAGQDLLTALRLAADQPTGAMEQATFYASRGDLDAAVGYARKAIAWDGASPPLRDSLANILILAGQTQQAAEQLEWATKLDPRDASYAYKLGLIYDKLQRADLAIDALKRAEHLDPSNPQIPYARALIHLRCRQKEEAREAASRALQIDPNLSEAAQILRLLGR
jgi:tetratricopeptide (TPR) repeat protein